MTTNREWLYGLDPSKLAEWFEEEHVEGARETRNNYEERLYEVPVSECPYCGRDRVVIHEYNELYEKPHSYRVEHVSELEAFNAECFDSYFGFDSVEKAVAHADMRDGELRWEGDGK